jgi:uncharacterized membrane protein (UPF0127 family)
MPLVDKIAKELFQKHPQIVKTNMARMPIQAGERIIDAGVPDMVGANRPEFTGVVRKVVGSRFVVDWDDGTTEEVRSSVVRRMAHRYEQPLEPYIAGDSVILGNGDRGIIVAQVSGGTNGSYRSYSVKVTHSNSPRDIGRRVFATPLGMKPAISLRKDARIIFYRGKVAGLTVHCELARTSEEQRIGLQKVSSIDNSEAMLFYYNPPRDVAFHMGQVRFPIDMIFAGPDLRIANIVHNIQPKTKGHWGMVNIAAVVELRGGVAKEANLKLGDLVGLPLDKMAQEYFEPSQNRPDWHTRRPTEEWRPGEGRYQDRQIPDDMVGNDNYLDNRSWHQEIGYDPANPQDDNEGIVPQRPNN